jgi:23S rRNA pseudouridine1911/1915/1917 synthase
VARETHWVVREGDGPTLGDVVKRAGADAEAIREGRVFIDKARASDARARVELGTVVTVSSPTEALASVRILLDEDGLVATDKPAGIPTIPDQTGSSHALLAVLARTLGCDPSTLHATSRLDRDVSGVVLFARTREAAERLTRARSEGSYLRRYVAIATLAPASSLTKGEWTAPIGRAKDPKKRAAFGRDAVPARSLYEVVAPTEGRALLALEPLTGRTHQLRVHASHAGAPLLGDRAYGGDSRVVLGSGQVVPVRRIALHCARVVVPSASGHALEASAKIPKELRDLWTAMGGRDEAWHLATDGPRLATP